MNRADLIRRGNILVTEYSEAAEAGCYLANGRFGAVMSGLGLNLSPSLQKKYPAAGQSQFTHIRHWGRFRFLSDAMRRETCADYILPLFKLYWEREPESVCAYRQCQDFYDGILETAYELPGGSRVRTVSWFDMVNKDLAAVRVEIDDTKAGTGEKCKYTVKNGSGARSVYPIKASVVTDFVPYPFLYRKRTAQSTAVKYRDGAWTMTIRCDDTEDACGSDIYFYSNAKTEICEDGIRFLLTPGSHEIYISYGQPAGLEERLQSFDRTRRKWHEIWENSGWFDFPEESAQKTWIRSLAYLISSYGDDCGLIQPTNGLTGNMFPFHFVQDLEYIAPALMMMGHEEIVKRWVEKFAAEIPQMREYAKSLWPQAKGIYPPWELPYGEIQGYHSPSVPVVYCYEPHNAAYLSRLARETAEFLNDCGWTETYAHPIIKEVAAFYKAFCHKKEDGRWHLSWYPCIGQDEAGGRNKSDYLCSMYSAKYSFQSAVSCGLDPDGSYDAILRDGLAFDSLLSERGTYHTACGADDFGKQKHPVQLDGLTYLPVEPEPLLPERKAYELRHDITDRAEEPFYFGWTLAQFLLAGSNLKDASGWRRDWNEIRKSEYTDSGWIQFYETSGEAEKSFYMTNHGMILQSMIRNYVNDYWGRLEIGACPVFDGEVSFGNIRTRLGITVSGSVTDKEMSAALLAREDGTYRVNENLTELRRDEEYVVSDRKPCQGSKMPGRDLEV